MRAILFPGQGSQYIGMGSDFYKKFDLVKKNFSLVDKSLGFSRSSSLTQDKEGCLPVVSCPNKMKRIGEVLFFD